VSFRLPFFSLLLCATVLPVSDALAGSILTPFNVIVSGNFADTGSDIGGGLAIGGNANVVNGWSAVDALNGEAVTAFAGSTTLIVAGSVTGAFNLFAGNYYVPNGTVNLQSADSKATNETTDPISFTTQFSQFEAESTQIANENPSCTSCASLSGGVLTINVNSVGLNIIDLTQAEIQGANEVKFVSGSGVTFASGTTNYGNACVLLNVPGTSVTFNPSWGTYFNTTQATGDNAYGAEDVVYNFYQATSIQTNVGGTTIVGSFLAPWATYTDTASGQFAGSLVAASFSGTNVEFHNLNFEGPTFTPEPAPLAGVGVGLIALALVLKRRAARSLRGRA